MTNIRGQAWASAQAVTSTGYFHVGLEYQPNDETNTTEFSGTKLVRNLLNWNGPTPSLGAGQWDSSSYQDNYFIVNSAGSGVSVQSGTVMWYSFTSGFSTGSNFAMPITGQKMYIAPDSPTGAWLMQIPITGANSGKAIYYRWTIGSQTPVAKFTGNYAHATGVDDSFGNVFGQVAITFVSGKLFEQIISKAATTSMSGRLTRYTVSGDTLTEDITFFSGLNNKDSTHRGWHGMSFISSGYGVMTESHVANSDASDTRSLWVYSGNTLTNITAGFPSSGARATFAVAKATGVAYLAIQSVNNAVTGAFLLPWSGGSFQTPSAVFNTSFLSGGDHGEAWFRTFTYDAYNDQVIAMDQSAAGAWCLDTSVSPPVLVNTIQWLNSIGPATAHPAKNADRKYIMYFDQTNVWHVSTNSWDSLRPGQHLSIQLTQFLGSGVALGKPDSIQIQIRDADNTGKEIYNHTIVPPNTSPLSTGFDVWMTSGGTVGGTPINGPFNMRLLVIHTGLTGYTGDSHNTAQGQDGIFRVGVSVPTMAINSDSPGGSATQNPYAINDTEFVQFKTQYTTLDVTQSTRTFRLENYQSGVDVLSGQSSLSSTSGANGGTFTGSFIISNLYDVGNIPTSVRSHVTTVAGFGANGAENWIHFFRPTGTEYTWVDKTQIEFTNIINVDPRTYLNSSGTGAATNDGIFVTYHPSSGTTGTTLFNKEEVVSGYTTMINARSEAITTSTATGTVVTNSGNETTFLLTHVGNGKYTGKYTTADTDEATHDDTGQWKKLVLQAAGSNKSPATGVNSWYLSNLWKVIAHAQNNSALIRHVWPNTTLDETTGYIISADLMFIWGYVANVRQESVGTAATIDFQLISPLNTINELGQKNTQADGWTGNSYIQFSPTAPAGAWHLKTLGFKQGANVAAGGDNQGNPSGSPNWGFEYEVDLSGNYTAIHNDEIVNFISAYRDNLKIKAVYKTSGQGFRIAAPGDPILFVIRPLQDGTGVMVDSGSVPHIRISRFSQVSGTHVFYVGGDTGGITMPAASSNSAWGTGADPYSYYYYWDTTGVPQDVYYALIDAKLAGAISFAFIDVPFVKEINQDFSPLEFALHGVKKTYLNPGDPLLSNTHNQIQGIGPRTENILYDTHAFITGMTVTGQSTQNVISFTRDANHNITTITETINNVLSGASKTITTNLQLDVSGKVTGSTTTVS